MSQAATPFPESMLLVTQDVIFLEVMNEVLPDDSLKDLYEVGGERYRAVVCWIRLVTLLEDGSDALDLHIFRNDAVMEGNSPYEEDRIRYVSLAFFENESRDIVLRCC